MTINADAGNSSSQPRNGQAEEASLKNPLLQYLDTDNPQLDQLKKLNISNFFSRIRPKQQIIWLEEAFTQLKAIDDFKNKPKSDEKHWPSQTYPFSPRQRAIVDKLQSAYVEAINRTVDDINAFDTPSENNLFCIERAKVLGGLIDEQTNLWQRNHQKHTHARNNICKKLMELPPVSYIANENPIFNLLKNSHYGKYCNRHVIRLALHNQYSVADNLKLLQTGISAYLLAKFEEILRKRLGASTLELYLYRIAPTPRNAALALAFTSTVAGTLAEHLEQYAIDINPASQVYDHSHAESLMVAWEVLSEEFVKYVKSHVKDNSQAIILALDSEEDNWFVIPPKLLADLKATVKKYNGKSNPDRDLILPPPVILKNPLLNYLQLDDPKLNDFNRLNLNELLFRIRPKQRLEYLEEAYQALIKIDDSAKKPKSDDKNWPREKYPLSPRQRQCIDKLQKEYVETINQVVWNVNAFDTPDENTIACITFAKNLGRLVDHQTSTWQRDYIGYTHARGEISKKLMELKPEHYAANENPVLNYLVAIQDGKYFCKHALNLAMHNTNSPAENLSFLQQGIAFFVQKGMKQILAERYERVIEQDIFLSLGEYMQLIEQKPHRDYVPSTEIYFNSVWGSLNEYFVEFAKQYAHDILEAITAVVDPNEPNNAWFIKSETPLWESLTDIKELADKIMKKTAASQP